MNRPRKKLLWFPVLLSVLLLSLVPVAGRSADLEGRVQKHVLDNGLKILVMERTSSPTVTLYIRHRAGAVDDEPGSTGTAHLLEHLMFKGTETIGSRDYRTESLLLERVEAIGTELDQLRKRTGSQDASKIKELEQAMASTSKEADALCIKNEIDRLYTENGARRHNASTGQDLTSYYVSLPAGRVELWARIESDRMMHPVFRDFYAERRVVMEERRQTVESQPGRILTERFLSAAFSAHPYGRPIIGNEADLRFLDIRKAREFFKKHYAPDHTVIAVVGNVSSSTLVPMLKRYFGQIPAVNRTMQALPREPLQTAERRIEVRLKASPELLIGYHKPSLPSFDDTVFDLIEALLSKGRTSRLYRSLVERQQIADKVNAVNGFPGNLHANLFLISASPRSGHTAREVEKALYEEIEKLKDNPVPEAELEKVRNQMRMDYLRDMESNSGMAGKLSYYEAIAGDYRYFVRHLDTIDRITPADIMKTARKYLRLENRTVAVLEREGDK